MRALKKFLSTLCRLYAYVYIAKPRRRRSARFGVLIRPAICRRVSTLRSRVILFSLTKSESDGAIHILRQYYIQVDDLVVE